MVNGFRLGRRALLGSAAGAAAFGLAGTASAQKPLVIGFIYVGPRDDYGYNQAHAEAAAILKKMAGLKVVEEEKVPETVAVEKSMESMINLDGATLVFPTSFGYFDPHMLKEAAKFPKIQFRHCGGLWTQGKHPMNTGSYFGYIDEAQYLAGIVAGSTSKSGKLGFVAAKPIPQVLRNINAFTLGAQSVNPKVTTQAIFTGDWAMPVKEAEATNSMIAQGVDVVTCHVDSPKVVIETAERAGIFSSGYHCNGNFVRGGLKEGFVRPSAYGPAAQGKDKADAAKAAIMAGSLAIYKGGLKDNKGNVVIPAGASYAITEPKLEGMNYLIEGVAGSTS